MFKLILLSLFLLGCGKKDSSSTPVASLQAEGGEKLGAFLSPVNRSLNAGVNGSVTLTTSGDGLVLEVSLHRSKPGLPHTLAIGLGRACPQMSADTNQDHLIDFNEANTALMAVYFVDGGFSDQLGEDTFTVSDSQSRSGIRNYSGKPIIVYEDAGVPLACGVLKK